MSVEIRPFPRPEWSSLPYDGCIGVEGKVFVREEVSSSRCCCFQEHGTIHEHPGIADTIVVCIGGRRPHIGRRTEGGAAGGTASTLAKGRPARLWTEDLSMVALMVEGALPT